jgi:hypothetical protein
MQNLTNTDHPRLTNNKHVQNILAHAECSCKSQFGSLHLHQHQHIIHMQTPYTETRSCIWVHSALVSMMDEKNKKHETQTQ